MLGFLNLPDSQLSANYAKMSPTFESSDIKTLPNYTGKTHLLNTGSVIPTIGLGTCQDPDEQELSVYTALKVGSRHIDTAHKYALILVPTFATWRSGQSSITSARSRTCFLIVGFSYGTERQVGKGIANSGIPREEIFVTTKLWCNSHHPDDVEPALPWMRHLPNWAWVMLICT